MPTTTASTGSDFMPLAWRAELPWQKSTTSSTPAPSASTATTVFTPGRNFDGSSSSTSSGSLIILDEIGRGTSTYDGLSIAWAVVEHLHRNPDRGPRTLFATHYQELTQLDKHLLRLRNLSVAVKEWNDDIVFVRRVVPGAADRSYGIQVARLAGLPPGVIDRAKAILARLEGDDSSVSLPAPQARPKKKITVLPADTNQLDLL